MSMSKTFTGGSMCQKVCIGGGVPLKALLFLTYLHFQSVVNFQLLF